MQAEPAQPLFEDGYSSIFRVILLSAILLVPIVSRVRPEDVVLLVLVFISGVSIYRSGQKIPIPRFTLFLIPYIFIVVWGIMSQVFLLNNPPEANIVMEILRPLRIIVIAVAIGILTYQRSDRHHLITVLMYLTTGLFFVSLVQAIVIIQLGPMYEPFAQYYAGSDIPSLINRGRVFGLARNPNRLAFLLIPGTVIACNILFQQWSRGVYSTTTCGLAFLTFSSGVFMIILSQSRGGLVSLLVAGGVSIALLARVQNYSLRWVIFVGAGIIILFLFLLYLGILPNRFGVLLRPWTSHSLQIRLNRWAERFASFDNTLYTYLFGHGPNKEFFGQFRGVDGEWLLTIFRYGIAGAAALLYFYSAIIRDSLSSLMSEEPIDQLLGAVSVGLAGAVIIYGLLSQVFHNQRIIALFVCVWAATCTQPYTTFRLQISR